MQNKAAFIFSLAVILFLHIYVLRSIALPKQVITVKPQKKVSPVINLQRVVMNNPDPVVEAKVKEIVAKPPKQLVEKMISAPPVLKKRAQHYVVKKKRSTQKRKHKTVARTEQKQTKMREISLRQQPSSPQSQAILNSYLTKVRNIIEKRKTYPRGARRMGREGRVKVEFTISANGYIADVRFVKRSPYSTLNYAATRLLKKIGTFPPIPKEIGKASLTLTVPIEYKILN